MTCLQATQPVGEPSIDVIGGQSGSTVDRATALYAADPGSIPATPHGPVIHLEVIP